MSAMARVTAKGQITIPAEVRRALGIATGDNVLFYRGLDGAMRIRVHRPRKGAGSGSFCWPDAPRSPAELDEAIKATIDEKHGPSAKTDKEARLTV